MVHSDRLHDAVTPVQVDARFRALPRRRAKLQKLESGAATALAKQARNTVGIE